MAKILEADRSLINLGDCMSPGTIIVEDCMAPTAEPETLRVRPTSKPHLIVDLSTAGV